MQTTFSRSQNIFSALSFHTIAAIPLCGLALLYYNHTRSTPLPSSTRAAIIAAGHSAATSHLRLSDTRSSTITLRDGRQLGYSDLGSPTGTPIFALHGTPGSRIDYEFWHTTALRLNARILSLDRPGIGLSTQQPGRTLLDHADDVKQLADHLQLDRYGVVGMSGGGPYALACAAALPKEKSKAVLLVCGLGPPDIGYWGMAIPNYIGWTWGYRYAPALIRYWASWQPFGRLDLTDQARFEMMQTSFLNSSNPSSKDVELWLHHPSLFLQHLRSTRESFVHGLDSFTEDGRIMSSDWGWEGVKLEDIRKDLPVRLWYGTQDENVPANHGVQIARRIEGGAGRGDEGMVRLRVEDETHASLEVNWVEEQIKDLLEAMEGK